MIVKGKSRPAAGTLASYIVKKNENELVSVREVRGTVSQDVKGALWEMEAVAEGTNCKSFLYHASINPQEHEHLTPEQWQRAVEILEKELKLEDHQRVLVEHVKDGRAHYHCIWSRIDPETMKAVHMSGSYAAHERAARQMEREFGLERIQGVHAEREQGEIPARAPKSWEIERGKRTGVDPRKFTEEMTALWNDSKNGAAFAAELEARGYVLAKGDRRDFVIIDGHGDPHSLARRTGARAADVRAKMGDIDRDDLPNVAQAQEMQLERAAKIEAQRQQEAEARELQKLEHEKERAARLGATLYDRPDMVSMNHDAMRDLEERTRFKEKEQSERQQQEAQKHKEQERQGKTAQEREGQARRQAEEGKPKTQEARRDQAQEKRQERSARTEQTEAQVRRSQKEAMRELFERKFGRGHNAKDREDWERERER